MRKPRPGDVYYDSESDVLGLVAEAHADLIIVQHWFSDDAAFYSWLDYPVKWSSDFVYLGTI
jgi:hypothetical protein